MSGKDSKSKIGGLSAAGLMRGLSGMSEFRQTGYRMDDDDELDYEPGFRQKIGGGLNEDFELPK
jgi:hypothetical protein